MPRTTLRDNRILHWSECGLPDGVPVVFLHGCPDTRRASWSGHEAARRTCVRLLAANRPGYGASTPAAPSYRRVVDDVAELADSLRLEQFAVLGMSVGGTFARACAAFLPDRVTHATLVGTPGGEAPRMDPAYPRDDLDESARAFFDSLASGTPEENLQRVRPDFLACRADIAPDDPDDVALASRWPPRCHPRTGPSSTGRRSRSPRRRARRSASRTATWRTRPWCSGVGRSASGTSGAPSPSGTASATPGHHPATASGWPSASATPRCR